MHLKKKILMILHKKYNNYNDVIIEFCDIMLIYSGIIICMTYKVIKL